MAYKSLTFINDSNTLSISEVLTTDNLSITAEQTDHDNPYAAYMSFDLDYDDICTLIQWLDKAKKYMEEHVNA